MRLDKILLALLLANVLALDIATTSLAQGPPIQTDNAITLGLEGAAVRFYAEFESTPTGNRIMAPFMVPFEIGSQLQAGFTIPYLSQGGRTGLGSSGAGRRMERRA